MPATEAHAVTHEVPGAELYFCEVQATQALASVLPVLPAVSLPAGHREHALEPVLALNVLTGH